MSCNTESIVYRARFEQHARWISKSTFSAARVCGTLALLVASFCWSASSSRADVIAFSDFGPGITYGAFGNSVGGQFKVGYEFNSLASGLLSQIAVGIGGNAGATFDLGLYANNAGVIGTQLWSQTGIPVGAPIVGQPGKSTPAVISGLNGPMLAQGQNYWLLASGPTNSAYWSANTIGVTGNGYFSSTPPPNDYQHNVTLGAFSVSVVPEPSTSALLASGIVGLVVLAWRRKMRG